MYRRAPSLHDDSKELGYLGLIGFPLVAIIYAIIRKVMAPGSTTEAMRITHEVNETKKHPLYPQFVSETSERQYLSKEFLPNAFQLWLEDRNSSKKSS